MKHILATLALAAALSSGCMYGGAAAAGNSVVVLRSDTFLFGMLRKAFVCQVTPAGLSGCASGENP